MFSNGYEENCNVDEEFLYPPEILKKLDTKKSYVDFNPPISIANPGENLILRPLCLNDYHRGYLDLLAQLTRVGDVSEQQFKGHGMEMFVFWNNTNIYSQHIKLKYAETFQEMKSAKNRYFVTVIEDLTSNQIIGTATLAVEKKFIHSAGLRGRLEDVVISNEYRGKQLGKLIVIAIRLLAEHIGCYKISLDCKDKMVRFYNQFGFVCESGNSNMMTIRFKD